MKNLIRALTPSLALVLILAQLIAVTPAFAAEATRARIVQTYDGLTLGGSDSYVTFGTASALGLANFTVETWFRRDSAGVPAYTGTGGVMAIPLVAKGRHEDDGSNVDMNYFLGIESSTGVLTADFEEKPSGLNHPILGITPIRMNTWYHAAVTYDGTTLRLYLNGFLERELVVAKPVRNDSIQHAAIGSALDSTGAPEGFFGGAIDEVRIWDHARTILQIKEGMRYQINSATSLSSSGLVAQWGFNEGSGTSVYSSVSQTTTGTIKGGNWNWSRGRQFESNRAPLTPNAISPAAGSTVAGNSVDLNVQADDPEGDNLQITWYGRVAGKTGDKFSIAVLPDTQYYSGSINGGTPAMFNAQTQWIVNNRKTRNISYVAHLGDIVENGNSKTTEWSRAVTALKYLEDPATTGLPDGIPYGLAVGNHDQTPDGDPTPGSTKLYNQNFGTTRFRTRNYYGGRFDIYQDNHYQFFSASGMDFMVIYLEHTSNPSSAVLKWADQLIKTHPDRRVIVVMHSILGYDANFSSQGLAIFNALKNNSNFFLMLCGHNSTEQKRQDIGNGQTIYTLLSDYQFRTNGGNGWMRLLEFDPSTNRINVSTLSPYLNQTESDADSSFSLSYDMQNSGFAVIGSSSSAVPGATSTTKWSGLAPNTTYEWYVTVSDGVTTVKSAVMKFKTGN